RRRRPGPHRRPRRPRHPPPARPAPRSPPGVHAHDGGAALRGRDDAGGGGTRLRDVGIRRPQATAWAAIDLLGTGGAMNGRVVGDWQLERYRLAELPASEQEALRAAIAADDGLRARLAALDESDREILARHPPAVLAAAIRARAEVTEAPVT